MRKKKKQFKVIILVEIKPHPDRFEETVARTLAQEFQSDILFIKRETVKTPDVMVCRTKQFWEIKNIKGNSSKTIEDNLRRAAKQADNIVISLLRSQMTPEQAASHIRHYLSHARGNIKRVILITKKGKIIDF